MLMYQRDDKVNAHVVPNDSMQFYGKAVSFSQDLTPPLQGLIGKYTRNEKI